MRHHNFVNILLRDPPKFVLAAVLEEKLLLTSVVIIVLKSPVGVMVRPRGH